MVSPLFPGYRPTNNDEIYPRNPGQPLCACFAKRGRCTMFDSEGACPWDHAIDDLQPSVLCLYLEWLDTYNNANREQPDKASPAGSSPSPKQNQTDPTKTGSSEPICVMHPCWFCGASDGGTIQVCACVAEFQRVHPDCLAQFQAATGFGSCSLCGQSYCTDGSDAAPEQMTKIASSPECGEFDPWEQPLTGLELPGADEIWHSVYLGSMEAAADRAALQVAGVTAIIDLSRRENPRFNDIAYLELHIHDHPEENIGGLFNECFSFIRAAKRRGGSVLVHFKFGRSRSATIVIAYLMLYEKLSFREAITLCVSRRPDARPNGGFIKQLLAFEKEIDVEF